MMRLVALTGLVAISLVQAGQPTAGTPPADAIVALDGSGQYRTVQAAIDAAPQHTTDGAPWVILVRPGTYREVVYVQREKRFVALVGEDPTRTVITYDLHASTLGPNGKPLGTFRTPTVTIDADDFTTENLTFQNDAGPVGQAVAVRVDGDRVVFRNCRFIGWQDTLLLNRGRQYIVDSLITGHVDFVFGGATAYFDRCRLLCRRNGYITAASTPQDATYGFVFADGTVGGAAPDVRTYLGRPWRDFARVLFMRTEMTAVVRPEGWHNWDRPEREHTARFMESGNTGPGARRSERVAWSKALAPDEAAGISASSVLRGADNWNPSPGALHASTSKATAPPLPNPDR